MNSVYTKSRTPPTLGALKAAVLDGELDEAITEVSMATRDGFGK